MDIDIIEESEQQNEKQEASSSSFTAIQPVVVDDNHPFDLDSYINQYKGPQAILDRLIHIIPRCPPLALPAVQIALRQIPSLRDITMYRALRVAYEYAVRISSSLPPLDEVIPLDQKWIDEVATKNNAERTKLEIELKTYTSNMIKESIRVRVQYLSLRN